MNRLCLITALLLIASFAAAGCASTPKEEAAPPTYTRMLSHPELLRPSPGLPGGFGWTAPDANMQQYTKVLVDHILVKLEEDSKSKAIDPTTLAGLVEMFHKDLVQALEPQYPVVQQGGPGVLIARITLVDLVPTDVTTNVVFQVIPFGGGIVGGAIAGEAQGTGMGSPPYLGRTGIVAEFRDGQTNKVIGEFANTQFGKQYVVDMNAGVGEGFEKGTSAYMNSFSKWSYAEQAFKQWSAFFRKRLDELRGATPPPQ